MDTRVIFGMDIGFHKGIVFWPLLRSLCRIHVLPAKNFDRSLYICIYVCIYIYVYIVFFSYRASEYDLWYIFLNSKGYWACHPRGLQERELPGSDPGRWGHALVLGELGGTLGTKVYMNTYIYIY